ncbi:MAG TPA: methyl-accepting chemotaxis protein, partial [Ramlibacter sp.]|uniref:methyl-accepting chemotaxis protein n=1 Tax=Ramlibacter sp. TaxID=1917967 RepID=UPI002D496F20|nr:methyl-accepting chemotaxis protein [Ramlibacter sp.]
MRFQTKLPLACSAMVVCTAGAAVTGLLSLQSSEDGANSAFRAQAAAATLAQTTALDFKVQVQEWKNTLLRGKDPKALDKHWSSFQKQEQLTAAHAAELRDSLPPGETRDLVSSFLQAHTRMGKAYREGFEKFGAAGQDGELGDRAVQGIDREPVKLLDEAVARIHQEQQASAAATDAVISRTFWRTLLFLGLAALGSVAGAVVLSRRVVRQLGGDPADAVAAARRVADGDLSVAIVVRDGDTTSLLMALKRMQDSLSQIVDDVRQNADSVATASGQISQGNSDLSSRTEEQASALQQTAASMKQLASTVKQNADNAQQGNELALAASTVAVRGGEVVGQVV